MLNNNIRLNGVANITRCPFNIRANKSMWLGLVGAHKGFAKFVNLTYGVRAGIILVRNYVERGFNTIEKIINRYAPENENNTENYIFFVSCYVQISPYQALPSDIDHIFRLCQAITFYECGYELPFEDFLSIVKQFNIRFKDEEFPY